MSQDDVHICVHGTSVRCSMTQPHMNNQYYYIMNLIKKAFKIYFPDINYHISYAELNDGRYATAYNKDDDTIVDVITKQEFDAALVYNLLAKANKKSW